jgi:hypothetical protein
MAEKPPSVSYVEKAEVGIANGFDCRDEETPTPPDQDWTEEEERALVYAFHSFAFRHGVRLTRNP